MKQTIHIPMKPFSVNAMYYATIKAKTKEAKAWSYQVFHHLSSEENQEKMTAIREFFDPKLHQFHVKVSAKYPKGILFKSDGSISARAHDVTNFEKPIVDLLFLPVHARMGSPYGCQNIQHDDKYITRCVSEKIAHKKGGYSMDITIHVKPLHPGKVSPTSAEAS